jgi:hypothetical protein
MEACQQMQLMNQMGKNEETRNEQGCGVACEYCSSQLYGRHVVSNYIKYQ